MNKSYINFTLLFSLLCLSLSAQLNPQQAIAEMGRGINLGNTLEPPREGEWNNGPARESYFDAYSEAGFSNIRIPVRWDLHTSNSAPYAINTNWMNRVEQVVDWGLERGFYITLNGHHEDWLKNNYSTQNQARYDSIWVQIAERFKDKSEKLLFEIINEPRGLTRTQVDELNERILGIIRKTNPTRIVIYGGNEWANAPELLNAKIPDDDYVIGYYHAYDPWQFSGVGNGTWGTTFDYQQITNKYNSVKNWSDRNNIPIHHSEFGAIHDCDFNSRMRIYAHNVEQCIINGFAFSVWDDGGMFRVLNRGNNTWPEIKDVLIHYHEDSPNEIFSTFSLDPDTEVPSVKVEWNNRTSGNGKIFVERAVDVNGNFVQIAELPADATTYIDSTISANRTYTYRMYTTRDDGTLLHGYPTRVRVTATQQTPYNSSPINIPGTLEVEEYDEGGEGLAYHDTDAANVASNFRPEEGVDIGTFGSWRILESVKNGEWIEYTVAVAESGTYAVEAQIATEQPNGTFNIIFDKNNAAGTFRVPLTGGWTAFQNLSADRTVELEAGVQQMRLNITNDIPFNMNRIHFTLEASTSTAELEAIAKGFKISPNPTDGILKIDLSNDLKSKNGQLELLSFTGQKIATFQLNESSPSIDLSRFEKGIYLLRFTHEELNLVHRVVIQ